eukprot:10969948-Alexandrium_andersonii.AAC.1
MAARAAENFERRAAKHGRVQMCSTHMACHLNADTEGPTEGDRPDRGEAVGGDDADAPRSPRGKSVDSACGERGGAPAGDRSPHRGDCSPDGPLGRWAA